MVLQDSSPGLYCDEPLIMVVRSWSNCGRVPNGCCFIFPYDPIFIHFQRSPQQILAGKNQGILYVYIYNIFFQPIHLSIINYHKSNNILVWKQHFCSLVTLKFERLAKPHLPKMENGRYRVYKNNFSKTILNHPQLYHFYGCEKKHQQ